MDKDLFDYIKMGWNKMTASKKNDVPSHANSTVESQSESPAKKAHAEAQDTTSENVAFDEKPVKAWNYIAFQEKMPDLILEKIQRIGIKPEQFPDRDLVVFCNDPDKIDVIKENKFDEHLDEYIYLKKDKSFRSITVKEGVPGIGMVTSQVSDEITIALCRQERAHSAQRSGAASATLEVLGTRCKLLNPDLVLEPEDGNIYNIGWGENTNVGGILRTNQIAWDYANPEKENTKVFLVSRAHAHIKFTQGCFNLIVDIRGTRQAGKRTKVQRGEQIDELTVPGLTYPLQDKDIIILNSEKMKFHQPRTKN